MNLESTERTDAVDNRPWYVIQTQSRHEDKVETALARKGLETYLPRITYPSRRRDRKVILQAPLFPGYLFLRAELDPVTFHKVIKVDGIVRLLGNKGPTPVGADTVSSIRHIVEGDKPFYQWRFLEKGKQVRVIDGPLAGTVGIIVGKKEKKRRLVVNVELFKRSLAVELDDDAVERWS
ncbi:MAG: transcription termination/antitermination NusG family protein [Syntrophales bacterium]|nr:transcription termination/antitermination NusG family protein [Syntrophales bacterium]MDD5643198.1 transcription termination/antitermination NusG family protein [Syntrophales bacterium]